MKHAVPPTEPRSTHPVARIAAALAIAAASAVPFALPSSAEAATYSSALAESDYENGRDVNLKCNVRIKEHVADHGNGTFLCELVGSDRNGVERTYRALAVAETQYPLIVWGTYYTGYANFASVIPGSYTLGIRDAVRYETKRYYDIYNIWQTIENGVITFDDFSHKDGVSGFITLKKMITEGGTDTAAATIACRAG